MCVVSGRVIPFPRHNAEPRNRRVEALGVRARHHALVAELIELEIQCRAAGYIDETADLEPMVEEAAGSLRDFERSVAGP